MGIVKPALLIAVMTVFAAPAWARQALPQSVADPYRAYQAALEDGDAEAVLDAARRAREAARAAELDGVTLGVLTENYAYALAATGHNGEAMAYWDEAARLGERSGISRLDQAWRWYNAAASAMRADQLARARRRIVEATDIIEDFTAEERAQADFMAEVWFLAARIEGQDGRPDHALIPAREALRLYEAEDRPPDAGYAYLHHLAGMASASMTRTDDAVYHLHMARDIAVHIGAPDPFLIRVKAIHAYVRDYSIGPPGQVPDRVDVEDRLAANPLHQSRFSGWNHEDEDEEPERPPGYVAAEPIQQDPPRFPMQAAREGQQGFVIVRFAIEADGRTSDIEIVDALPNGAFAASALRAVSDWRFQPATIDGEPVREDEAVTHFHYRLR